MASHVSYGKRKRWRRTKTVIRSEHEQSPGREICGAWTSPMKSTRVLKSSRFVDCDSLAYFAVDFGLCVYVQTFYVGNILLMIKELSVIGQRDQRYRSGNGCDGSNNENNDNDEDMISICLQWINIAYNAIIMEWDSHRIISITKFDTMLLNWRNSVLFLCVMEFLRTFTDFYGLYIFIYIQNA